MTSGNPIVGAGRVSWRLDLPGAASEVFDSEIEARANFDAEFRRGVARQGKLILVVEIEAGSFSKAARA